MEEKTIEGRVVSARHMNDNGFYLLELSTETEIESDTTTPLLDSFFAETVKVIGTAEILPAKGHKVSITGRWHTHPRYSKQFKATEILFTDSNGAIEALLGSGFLKHIKAAKAVEMARTLGSAVFDVLDAAAEGKGQAVARLLSVKGIGKITGPEIIESWKEERYWAKGALACIRAGLTLNIARKARSQFAHLLEDTILKYPYRLTIIRGMTWERADKIAKMKWDGKIPIPHDSAQRYAAALREVLNRAHKDGQMCLPQDTATHKAVELCSPGLPLWETIGDTATDEGLKLDGGYLYLSTLHALEAQIADLAAGMMASPPRRPVPNALTLDTNLYSMLDLAPEQRDAVRMALANRISIITGGPGTGKTVSTRVIVNALSAFGKKVALCSPTGKAADRLGIATELPASTIHRALGLVREGMPRRVSKFEADFIIVDEVSMLDSALAYQLLDAVLSGAQIVLIGDVDQLPSVGAGEVLYQLIQAGVPTTRLTAIYRQAKESGIVYLAHDINRGVVPQGQPLGKDCYLGEVTSNSQLASQLERLLPLVLDKYSLSLDDLQILTPVNGNPWGQKALNLALQNLYNPGKNPLPGCVFRPDDKVIHLKNNYSMNVFNGMTGRVLCVCSKDEEEIELAHMKEGSLQDADGNPMRPSVVQVQYRDKAVWYTREDLQELGLAYALTIHKCIPASSRIWTEHGIAPIASVSVGDNVATGYGVQKVTSTFNTEEKETWIVETRSGLQLLASAEHPVLASRRNEPEEFTTVSNLRTGDYVCINRQPLSVLPLSLPKHTTKFELPTKMNISLAYLLGILVGDGSYRDKRDGAITITGADKEVIDAFQSTLSTYGCRVCSYRHKTRTEGVERRYVVSRGLRKWLCSLGLDYLKGPDKKTPWVIWQSPTESRAAYIRGLMDTDGSVSKNGLVRFTTSSESLARETQELLLSLGVVSYLTHQNEKHWKVQVSGTALGEFASMVGFNIERKSIRLHEYLKRQKGKTSNDYIPYGPIVFNEIKEILQVRSQGRADRGLYARGEGYNKARGAIKSKRKSYKHLRILIEMLEKQGRPTPESAVRLLENNWFFDKIVSVRKTGATEKMVDIEVEANHSFVSSGFVCHNSQGSEFKAVIMLVPFTWPPFMLRQLLYTGLTRAREYCLILAVPAALEAHITNEARARRYTRLAEMIKEKS